MTDSKPTSGEEPVPRFGTMDAGASDDTVEIEHRDRAWVKPAIEGYEITREIHRGGQGVVYQAIQKSTKRKVAIKFLLQGAHASKAAKRRFEREIELVAQLRHPNIIAVFDSGSTSEGLPFCVMDYIHGEPLHKYVRNRRLPLEDTLKLAAIVCEAVQYAHQKGVIHRDLKPSNILVTAEGDPKVLDFGLAKLLAAPTETLITISQEVIGTLPYMSPEQARGSLEEVDTRSDVYSLGVVLYELLTGDFPYPVQGQMAEILNHIYDTPPTPPIRKWNKDSGVAPRKLRCPIDDDVQTIVLKALSKDRDRRYQNAGDIARDLRHYLAGDAIEARRDSSFYVLKKMIRRHRSTVGVLVLIALLLPASTLTFLRLWQKAEAAKSEAISARAETEKQRDALFSANERARTLANDLQTIWVELTGVQPDILQRLRSGTVEIQIAVKKSPTAEATKIASGSGFLISATGLVITANHNVDLTHRMSPEAKARMQGVNHLVYSVLVLQDQEYATYTGRLAYHSEADDVAILKISDPLPNSLPPYFRLQRPPFAAIGSRVFAAGFGLRGHTTQLRVTAGKVHSIEDIGLVGRSILTTLNMPLRPGYSGGPAVDDDGFIIGSLITRTTNGWTGLASAESMIRSLYSLLANDDTLSTEDALPFLHLMVNPEGFVERPGWERPTDSDVLVTRSGELIQGRFALDFVSWTSNIGEGEIPASAIAYIVCSSNSIDLFLEGGDRLTTSQLNPIKFIAKNGNSRVYDPSDVAMVRFRKVAAPSLTNTHPLIEVRSDDTTLILATSNEKLRFYLNHADPNKYTKRELALDEIRACTFDHTANMTTVVLTDGRRFQGRFGSQPIRAVIAATRIPILIRPNRVERMTTRRISEPES